MCLSLGCPWPGGTHLCAGFYCPLQPLPSHLDATPLGLNVDLVPECCPLQGTCQFPQGLHLGLAQALNFLSESIKLLLQHLQGHRAREGHSGGGVQQHLRLTKDLAVSDSSLISAG